jgi:hypothetical protein
MIGTTSSGSSAAGDVHRQLPGGQRFEGQGASCAQSTVLMC